MSKRSPITTHILDVSAGKPAANVSCKLEKQNAQLHWEKIGEGVTNSDGRIENLLSTPLLKGVYRLEFLTKAYFEQRKLTSFYPAVTVHFEVTSPDEHYHVPLLLSPYGYSTYRGS
ncbi:MAG: hydroxyisourate hydrolase [Deltaproteobacteria bacterium]|nr:hydroxyisourate hydrolase [Deltaproteobacteria bacterium]